MDEPGAPLDEDRRLSSVATARSDWSLSGFSSAGMDSDTILGELPECLRTDVQMHLLSELVESVRCATILHCHIA